MMKKVAGWTRVCLTLLFSLTVIRAIAAEPLQGEAGDRPAVSLELAAAPAPSSRSRAAAAASDEAAFDALIDSIFAAPPGHGAAPGSNKVPEVKPAADSVESMNRAFYSFNDALLMWVMRPIVSGYDFIMPEYGRKGVKKIGLNLGYPDRLINTLLQGRLVGASVETGRFLVNTTVGLLGFYDPASHIGLHGTNADFSQTFYHYGAGEGSYLVLPFLGPGTGRDTLALPLDMVANPATFIPGAGTFFTINKLSLTLPTIKRMRESQRDPYVIARDLWSMARKVEIQEYEISKSAKSDPVPTLGAIFLDVKDPDFESRAIQRKVKIASTGQKLPYSLWLQDHKAPLVFILPGVGSHRNAGSALALAELAYRHGYSPLTVSSAMNWEFMEKAGTTSVPGYTPDDARDVYMALNAIYHDLKEHYPGQFSSTALMGLSMGALHTLFISTSDAYRQPDDVHFDRFVAINPPVDLLYALHKLDGYYNAPLEWRPEERQTKMENALLKAVKLAQSDFNAKAPLPLDSIESRYLIGLNFRLILRDIIYSSQQRENLGLLSADFHAVSRQPAYDQIAQYSFIDYIRDFVLPFYLYHPELDVPRKEFIRKSNLWYLERELHDNPKVRVFTNANDFLLRQRDIEWFKKTLGSRATIFSDGGHLGNLYVPAVQEAIMGALADLH